MTEIYHDGREMIEQKEICEKFQRNFDRINDLNDYIRQIRKNAICVEYLVESTISEKYHHHLKNIYFSDFCYV